MQLIRRHGARLIVNVGSVGFPGIGPGTPDLPTNRGVTWAEYGILDLPAGHTGIELRRLPLDLTRVLADGRASGMPHYDWWRALWA